MLPAPFYSELPLDLGDDRAWCALEGREPGATADFPTRNRDHGSTAWLERLTTPLRHALNGLVWGYSSWT